METVLPEDDAVDPLDYIYEQYKQTPTLHRHSASAEIASLAIPTPRLSPSRYCAADYQNELSRVSSSASIYSNAAVVSKSERNEVSPFTTLQIPASSKNLGCNGTAISRSYTSSTLPLRTSSTSRAAMPHAHSTLDTRLKSLLPALPKGLDCLSSQEYESCINVWSRREVFAWAVNIGPTTEEEFIECTAGLFTHHIPTLASQAAYKIARDLCASYCAANEIRQPSTKNPMLVFASEAGDGVLPTFTQKGCYSARCHLNVSTYRCYSSRCSRTIPMKHVRPVLAPDADNQDWAEFWGLQPDSDPMSTLQKLEIQRQYQIHELVYSETDYLSTLRILVDVFQAQLHATEQEDDQLNQLVFGNVSSLIRISKDLEASLRERQATQGPVIQHIGDIFVTWIKSARNVYVQYAAQMRYADRAVRAQKIRNPAIRDWLARCEADPRTNKLDFSSFQSAPTRRMQRYALLLGEAQKKTLADSSDYDMLTQAIAEVKSVCQACDSEVRIAESKIALLDLQERLVWRVPQVNLALSDPSRRICKRGLLERKSETHTQWQSRELVLLDNYLLCLKSGKNNYSLILSKPPISVDYLVVEECDEILYKSSSSKLIGGTITRHAVSPSTDARSATMPQASSASLTGSTKVEMLFPLTVKHAGKFDKGEGDEQYTFYASSVAARLAWIQAIYRAKASRWQEFASKEPFSINVLSHQAFGSYAHPAGFSKTVSELSEIASGIDDALAAPSHPGNALSVSRIQCSAIYIQSDKVTTLLGTDDGVYSNATGPWNRILAVVKVSQVAVLEEFGVVLVLADKILLAYALDDLSIEVQSRKPPQRLSDSKDVAFFEVGKMKERTLVIYKKRANGNSVFSVLEPVVGKKHEKASFFKKKVGTDFFRDFDVSFGMFLLTIAILYTGGVLRPSIPEVGDLHQVRKRFPNYVT